MNSLWSREVFRYRGFNCVGNTGAEQIGGECETVRI